MKKEKYYNTYFLGNIGSTEKSIAFAQSVDRLGIEEFCIRVVPKSVLVAVCQGSPKSVSGAKEFLAFDPVVQKHPSISLPTAPRMNLSCLKLVEMSLGNKEEEILFVGTSAGILIYHNNLTKMINLYDKFSQHVFTSIAVNDSEVYVSQYNGQIERIVYVDQFVKTPLADLKETVTALGVHKGFLLAGLNDGTVVVFDTKTDKKVGVVEAINNMCYMTCLQGLSDDHCLIGYSNGQAAVVNPATQLVRFSMALNTRAISCMDFWPAKGEGQKNIVAVAGEDGVVECLSYNSSKVAFECEHFSNTAERIIIGITFCSESNLAVIYNDFQALSFVITC